MSNDLFILSKDSDFHQMSFFIRRPAQSNMDSPWQLQYGRY